MSNRLKNVEPEPNVLEIAEESAVHNRIRSPGKLVRETEVYTFVGRSAEIAVLIACARGCDGKAAGQDAFQVQLDAFVTGKIILEKKRNIITLAVWHRDIFAPRMLCSAFIREKLIQESVPGTNSPKNLTSSPIAWPSAQFSP